MREVNWHTEVLNDRQDYVLKRLGPVTKGLNFYLAGGTAAALYFGHRRSADLDWFTAEKLKDPLSLARELESEGVEVKVKDLSRGTLHCMIKGVRVSFFEYLYPLLSPLVPCDAFGCLAASLEDIACMKLVAIAQRGFKKDFLDIYAICKRYKRLSELLKLSAKKFALEDSSSILYGLTYFEDADRERAPEMLWRIDWRRVKGEIREWVREAVGK